MDQTEVRNINTYLAMKYGTFHEQPRFRLTWTTDHFEVRRGQFGQIVNGLVVATSEDVRKVYKYGYCLNRWLLEEIVVNASVPGEILDQGKLSYEPRLLFQEESDASYQEPTLLRIDQACHWRLYGTLKGHVPTEAQMAEKREQFHAANRARIREMIDEEVPDMTHALVHGHAVFMDATKRKET